MKIMSKEELKMTRADKILRRGIQQLLNTFTEEQLAKFNRCSETLHKEDIVTMLRDCEFIVVANLNILDFDECQLLNLLYQCYRDWNFSEQFVDIDEKLKRDNQEDVEIYYDFELNKWTIKQFTEFSKKEYFISFSDFSKMRKYILKELR